MDANLITAIAAVFGSCVGGAASIAATWVWQLLQFEPAWEGIWTWDCILAFGWHGADGQRLLVTVNFAGNQSQCYVRLPFSVLGDGPWRLRDLMYDAVYDRDGRNLRERGLYLDLPPWKASVLELT